MKRIALLVAAGVLAGACGEPTQPGRENITAPGLELDEDGGGRVVRVAAPTGNPAVDVPNIEAAVAAARRGSTIQFARGTYAIEATTHIVVSTPRVTLQGHRRGTTIRGVTQPASPAFLVGHFLLNGGRQTVRRLTFHGFGVALSFGEPAPAQRTGGYRLENSVFRNGDVGFESVTFSNQVSTVRDNHFINVTIPFFIAGKTFRLLDNKNTNPNPGATPPGRPFNAGVLAPEFWSFIVSDGAIEVFPCENNSLESNRVSGNADGFILDSCRNTVIRRNLFSDQRLFPGGDGFPSFDDGSMVVGIGAGFEGNLIERNELRGSPGIGIVVEEGSGNRIVRNKFRNLVPGELAPFHATLLGLELAGTGILLGEPTTGNRVCDNEFKRVEHHIVDLAPRGSNRICRGDDDDDDGDDDRPGSTLRLRGTGERLRTLDHPKLRFLRDRMMK